MSDTPCCPLCLSHQHSPKGHKPVAGADRRNYWLCGHCALIFADPQHHLSADAARTHYATHQNHIENAGYVAFLNRVLTPALPFLAPGMRGLDYGCGPGPVLGQLVRRHGLACDDYDPLFANRPLTPPYDFIFSTETWEHFREPAATITHLVSLLAPGGLLGVMTERWVTPEQFATWYYTRDPTHVVFYHAETFGWIFGRFRLHPVWDDGSRVCLMRLASPPSPAP
jgi:SAM-dependent methyltransferase